MWRGKIVLVVAVLICGVLSLPSGSSAQSTGGPGCSVQAVNGQFEVTWSGLSEQAASVVVERRMFSRYWWRGKRAAAESSFVDGQSPKQAARVEYRISVRSAGNVEITKVPCVVVNTVGFTCESQLFTANGPNAEDRFLVQWSNPLPSLERVDYVVRRTVSPDRPAFWRGQTFDQSFRDDADGKSDASYLVIARMDRRIMAATTCADVTPPPDPDVEPNSCRTLLTDAQLSELEAQIGPVDLPPLPDGFRYYNSFIELPDSQVFDGENAYVLITSDELIDVNGTPAPLYRTLVRYNIADGSRTGIFAFGDDGRDVVFAINESEGVYSRTSDNFTSATNYQPPGTTESIKLFTAFGDGTGDNAQFVGFDDADRAVFSVFGPQVVAPFQAHNPDTGQIEPLSVSIDGLEQSSAIAVVDNGIVFRLDNDQQYVRAEIDCTPVQ